MRSAGCFLFSLLFIFNVLNVTAAGRFGCVAIFALYLSALLYYLYLFISLFCLYDSLLLSPIMVFRTFRLVL